MQVRDKLSTYEKYNILREKYQQYLVDYKIELKELFEYQKKGEEPYSAPLSDVISGTWDSILEYNLNILELNYSMGENLEVIKKYILVLQKQWKNHGVLVMDMSVWYGCFPSV